MGQFLSSTFLEGSPTTILHDKFFDDEHKGSGERLPVAHDQVMYWEGREL
jgi:hypothetical protein